MAKKKDSVSKADDESFTESGDEQSQVFAAHKNIYLFGEINAMSAGGFLHALHEADSRPGPITVYICSMGGWVEGGVAMYDAIRSSKNQIVTVGTGAVFSAAVLPFLAGDIRVLQPSARLMLHDMSVGMGEASLKQVRSVVSATNKMYDLYCHYVSSRSKLTAKQVNEFCQAETYVNAKECLKYGLTDVVEKENNKKLVPPYGKVKKK